MASSNHLPGTTVPPFMIFIGYDPREDAAYNVCRHSLLKHSSIPLHISPIKQSDLRSSNLYSRDRDTTESTEFSFTRFLTPYLAGFQDGPCLSTAISYTPPMWPISSVSSTIASPSCVYTMKTTKMDGAVQTVYPRKNWSSMVLYNCGHPKNRILTPELVSSETGAFLHRFRWLDDEEIGSVPFVWNFLVGHNRVVENDPTTFPQAIHYTLGGPWFERYKDCEFADLWLKELEECEKEKKGDN
ncbi:hypothetical protein M5K25_007475 [Dendrobium thyrsiflorum]|uniref:Uncharacterized protein n=1 Tax=Dendrobium thyrsiflorum TaxID=117978 RepID=A0ABD0VE80_DENTH